MNRGVAQLAERRTHNPNVAGSTPAPATVGPAGIPGVLVYRFVPVQQFCMRTSISSLCRP